MHPDLNGPQLNKWFNMNKKGENMRFKFVVFLAALLCAFQLQAQSVDVNFVTFGKECPTSWGDDDFNSVYFVELEQSAGQFYLWVFDPETGGSYDEINNGFNTETKFAVYGGQGAFSNENARSVNPAAGLSSGILLDQKIYSTDSQLDGKWELWGPYKYLQGEIIDGKSYFKITVEGISGNDGNVYNLFVSGNSSQRTALSGARLFTNELTIRYPIESGKDIEYSILPKRDSYNTITMYVFDADNLIGTSVLFSSGRSVPLNGSPNDQWSSTIIDPRANEQNSPWKIQMASETRGGIRNNDLVFYAEYEDGTPLPIDLPLRIRLTSSTKDSQVGVESVEAGCNSYIFDASETTDLNLGDQLSYHWDFGDGNTAQGIRVEHAYRQSGEYPITLTVRDNSGTVCAVSHITRSVEINTPPVADAGVNQKLCLGESVTLNGARSFDPDGEIVEYLWDFGDGTTGTGEIVEHTYAESGIYNAKLTVKDNSSSRCNTATETVTVHVNTPPVAEAGPDQRLGSTTVTFDGTQSYDPDPDPNSNIDPLIYTWDFGDGSGEAFGAKPVHNYEKPGTYLVHLKVQDRSGTDCDTDHDSLKIVINAPPKAIAGESRAVCQNEEIVFDASESNDPDGTINKYVWDLGDGTVVEQARVTHRYEFPGKYSVKLTVEDNAGMMNSKAVDGLSITVNSVPVAIAGRGQTVCSGQTVNFDGTKSYDPDDQIVEYTWDFGDGTPAASGAKVSHTYDKPGKYTAKLTVKDNSTGDCGTAVDEVVINVNQPPVAVAGEDVLTCEASVEFDGSGSYDEDGKVQSYYWDFGDGTTASGVSPAKVYKTEGTYKVVLRVNDNSNTSCNTAYDTMTVVINATPTADAGADNLYACIGEEMTFDGSGSTDSDGEIVEYTWDFGDGTPPVKGAKVTHAYAKPGNYIAGLSVKDNSGTDCEISKDEVFVKINEQPIAEAGPDKKTCVGEEVVFTGNSSYDSDGSITKYMWDFGDGSKAEGINVSHVYTRPGKYTVKLSVEDNSGTTCGTAVDNLMINVSEKPEAVAGGDVSTCNLNLTFDGSASKGPEDVALIYEWNFGDGSPKAGGVKTTHTYPRPGVYDVTLTVRDESGFGCGQDVDRFQVKIHEAPVAYIDGVEKACVDELISFDAARSVSYNGNIQSYNWDFGDGTSMAGMNVSHAYKEPGVYQVTLTITDDGGSECNTANSSMVVKVNETPYAEAGSEIIVCAGDPVNFDGSNSVDYDGEISSYVWNFGDGNTGRGMRPVHTYNESGVYDVSLTVTDNSGLQCNTNRDNIRVIVKQPPVAKADKDQVTVCIGCAQDEVTFNASDSYDPDGDGLTFDWDFGDGATGKGVVVKHAYTKPGNYKVVLTVTDDSGLPCNKGTYTINVKANIAPDPQIDIREKTGN